MALDPDDFHPVNASELREIWRRHRDEDVRRVILEVVRARKIMAQAHSDALRAQHAFWESQDGNMKAAIQQIVDAMLKEKIRLGSQGGAERLAQIAPSGTDPAQGGAIVREQTWTWPYSITGSAAPSE